MALHPCPRCKRLIPVGLQYCPDCRPQVEAELESRRAENLKKKTAAYNRKRSAKYRAFYTSKEWRTLSRSYLREAAYKCEAHVHPECTGLAVEVHHKLPIQTEDGWQLRLEWDNLEAVCTKCHNVRHPEKGRGALPSGVIDLRSITR
ncbi:MAG: HNH endonuclease [Alistipes sp.]|nr:HNH endonuclease [Alistipes sp.]